MDTLLSQKREHLPYQVEKVIVLEWMAVLGPEAFAIYNLYRCLADDGRALPSLRRVARHTSTSLLYVQLYNKVLVWSRLIDIVAGDVATPNEYIIIKPSPVTVELLSFVRASAQHDKMCQRARGFLRRSNQYQPAGLLDRIDRYEPFFKERRPVVASVPPPQQNGAADDGLVAQLLKLRGMRSRDALSMAQKYDAEKLGRWIAWLSSKDSINNQAAYLHTALSRGDEPPPVIEDTSVCAECGRPLTDGRCFVCEGLIKA